MHRSTQVTIEIDGRAVACFEGEVIATVLALEQDGRTRTDSAGAPRAAFCNMGVCCECMVFVQGGLGWRRVRACLAPVHEGQRVRTLEPEDV